ncbi:MAG: 2-dehydro-3-deoxy-6-phosphogalactonate aldolase [Alphaproteobacteria bacterium]|nr:2-dehydro-3-deoxy-6-phosphogalactonate aldolase [Alphaproteobacteria bacterium]
MTLDEALDLCPIVAILRGVRPDEVLAHGEALLTAGVRVVETPLNSPDPFASVARLAEAFAKTMFVGAGTVLTPDQAAATASAGGRLTVSPNTDPRVIRAALAHGLEAAPGFATASEAFVALEAGARRLKLFPAASYGPGHLRQLRAVLPPEVSFWAVGGVGPDDLAAWRAAGAAAFGIGGELYRPGQAPADTLAKARRLVEALRG